MRFIIFIFLYPVALIVLLLLVYNISGKNFLPLELGQGAAVVITVFSFFAFIRVMVSLVKAIRNQKWKSIIGQAFFLILFALLGKASFFVSMAYFGLVGNYTGGF